MAARMEERRKKLDEQFPSWTPCTVWQLFDRCARKYADRPFLITDSESISYERIRIGSLQAAARLKQMQVRAGMPVGIHLCNSGAFVIMTFALHRIGAVSVLLNPRADTRTLLPYLQTADTRLVITEDPEICRTLPTVRLETKAVRAADLLVESGEPFPEDTEPVTAPEDTACIIFTSGSTSTPKGVQMTGDMLLRSAFGTCRTRAMEDGRRIFLPIPLFHAMGYVEGMLSVMYVGGSIVITEEKFCAQKALQRMLSSRCSDIVCVSFIMQKLLEEQKKQKLIFPDFHAAYWASSCTETIWEEAAVAFGISDITTAYGMTECGSTTTMVRPEDPVERLRQSHGAPKAAGAAGMREADGALMLLQIRDPSGIEVLEPGTEGILWCRGLTVTPGYYHDPAATAAAFDTEGWFCTGDIGILYRDGYFRFLGRADDVYKINGENVSPDMVDSVIGRFPGVHGSVTVGVSDERYGQIGAAFVDLEEVTEETHGQLTAYLEEQLLSYQIPAVIIYRPSQTWPRTTGGKVLRKELKEEAERILADSGRRDGDVRFCHKG